VNHAGFVLGAWILVAVVLALYSVRLVLRGRALTRAVEPDRRRWLDAKDTP
jgi:hypothetical protein